MDATVQSVRACSEDIAVTKTFSYRGSVVHDDGRFCQEVTRRDSLAHSLNTSICRCRYLCRLTKIEIFKSLVPPVLLNDCEIYTTSSDFRRRIDIFDTTCLGRIMGYR